MRQGKAELFIHLIWATWDREPLITPGIKRHLYRVIDSEAQGKGCHVLAVNGMPDHVHLLVKIPATLTIAQLVKQVKGTSSHFVNEVLLSTIPFKWQGAYGAFSISTWDVEMVTEYIKRQHSHHGDNQLMPVLEEVFEEDLP